MKSAWMVLLFSCYATSLYGMGAYEEHSFAQYNDPNTMLSDTFDEMVRVVGELESDYKQDGKEMSKKVKQNEHFNAYLIERDYFRKIDSPDNLPKAARRREMKKNKNYRRKVIEALDKGHFENFRRAVQHINNAH